MRRLSRFKPDKAVPAVQGTDLHLASLDRDALGLEALRQLQGCHLSQELLLLLLAPAVLDELLLRFVDQVFTTLAIQ